jgi:Tol biopolymer transport system component
MCKRTWIGSTGLAVLILLLWAPALRADEAVPLAGPLLGTVPGPTRFSHDGDWLLFGASMDSDLPHVGGLWSVPTDGSASPIRLSPDLQVPPSKVNGVGLATLLPGGDVLFAADANVLYRQELYRSSIDGSSRTRLTTGIDVQGVAGNPAYRLSPDGSTVLMLDYFDASLHTVSPAGGDVWPVPIDVANPEAHINVYNYLPDGSRIVYRGDLDQEAMYELYSIDAAGVQTKLNLDLGSAQPGGTGLNSQVEQDLSIAPDSSRLLYRADPDYSQTNLYAVSPAGGGSTRLNPDGAEATSQHAFAGASRAVFRCDDSKLYVHDFDGPQPGTRQLSGAEAAGVSNMQLTPDDRGVVYVGSKPDNTSIQALFYRDLDGGEAIMLSDPALDDPSWLDIYQTGVFSANGTGVFYRVHPSDGDDAVWTSHLSAAASPTRLTPEGHDVTTFLLDPTGEWMFYAANTFGQTGQWDWETFLLDLDTGQLRKLEGPDGDKIRNLIFSPDGSRMAYTATDGGQTWLYVADVVPEPLLLPALLAAGTMILRRKRRH